MAIEWDNLVSRLFTKLRTTTARDPLRRGLQSKVKIGASHLKCLNFIAFRCIVAVFGVLRLPTRFFGAVARIFPGSFKQTEAETSSKQVRGWPNMRRSAIFVDL